jgi:hypothetical protein
MEMANKRARLVVGSNHPLLYISSYLTSRHPLLLYPSPPPTPTDLPTGFPPIPPLPQPFPPVTQVCPTRNVTRASTSTPSRRCAPSHPRRRRRPRLPRRRGPRHHRRSQTWHSLPPHILRLSRHIIILRPILGSTRHLQSPIHTPSPTSHLPP